MEVVVAKDGKERARATRNKFVARAHRTALGQRIKKARVIAELTQDDVTEQLGWSRQLLSKMERGLRDITSEELAKLADLYMVQVEWFATKPVSPKPALVHLEEAKDTTNSVSEQEHKLRQGESTVSTRSCNRADLLRNARLVAGISQERVAQKFGLRQMVLSAIERGIHKCSDEDYDRLMDFYESRTPKPKPPPIPPPKKINNKLDVLSVAVDASDVGEPSPPLSLTEEVVAMPPSQPLPNADVQLVMDRLFEALSLVAAFAANIFSQAVGKRAVNDGLTEEAERLGFHYK